MSSLKLDVFSHSMACLRMCAQEICLSSWTVTWMTDTKSDWGNKERLIQACFTWRWRVRHSWRYNGLLSTWQLLNYSSRSECMCMCSCLGCWGLGGFVKRWAWYDTWNRCSGGDAQHVAEHRKAHTNTNTHSGVITCTSPVASCGL